MVFSAELGEVVLNPLIEEAIVTLLIGGNELVVCYCKLPDLVCGS
jgi:hypothetical protein